MRGSPTPHEVLRGGATAAPDPAPELDRILAAGAVRTVYQPIVELERRRVVAYEALSRGPEGSTLERPDALFAAARGAGRLAELDWACRLAALRGALDGGLRPPLRLFVNVEPDTLGTAVPEHGAPLLARARAELDVVAELTERALTDRPAVTLPMIARLHALGMRDRARRRRRRCPVARPDAVRAARDHQAGPAARAGPPVAGDRRGRPCRQRPCRARGHAAAGRGRRDRGAAPHRPLARGPIRAGLALRPARSAARGPRVRRRAVAGRRSARRMPATTSARRRTRSCASTTCRGAATSGCCSRSHATSRHRSPPRGTRPWCSRPSRRPSTSRPAPARSTRGWPARRRSWARSASGLEAEPAPGVRGAALGEAEALRGEWNVIVISPHFAAAFVGLDCGDTGVPDFERRFDFCLTYDRDLAVRAARTLMTRLAPALSPAGGSAAPPR